VVPYYIGQHRALPILIDARKGHEVDVVNRNPGPVAFVTIDQIDQRVADALDGRNVEFYWIEFMP
jgi:uncharacterized protein YbjT (DUF2867 family)